MFNLCEEVTTGFLFIEKCPKQFAEDISLNEYQATKLLRT